ncbi:TPA: hypothetical protein ACK3JH_001977 [Mannheimia haemolytica]
MSCNSWSLEKGVTAPTEEKANLKRMLLQNATQKILVADSSKYGKYSLFCATQLNNFTQIITDKGLPTEDIQALSSNDFKLSLV